MIELPRETKGVVVSPLQILQVSLSLSLQTIKIKLKSKIEYVFRFSFVRKNEKANLRN